MVKVYYNGRLGNNMFQYALGRIIAEHKGYRLYANSIEMFPRTYDKVDGNEITDNILYVNTQQNIDLPSILNHKGGIVLSTFAQRYEYYSNYIDSIKEWFQLSPDIENISEKPKASDLVIHLRLEDYSSEGIVIDPNLLIKQSQKIIKEQKCNNGFIVTHDIKHPQVEYFKSCGFKLFNKSQIDDFIFMKHARNLIIAQSTFSWWAGVLGTGNVYVPWLNVNNKYSHWPVMPTDTSIDLRVQENRFFYFNDINVD